MAAGKPRSNKASPAKKTQFKASGSRKPAPQKSAVKSPEARPGKPGTHTPVYLRFVYAGMLLILLLGSFARIAGGRRSRRAQAPAATAVQAAGSGEAAARALVFRRSGSPCDELTVSTAGQAVLARCDNQGEQQYRLSVSERQQLAEWLDRYRSFEFSDPGTPQANAASSQLVFNGRGAQAPAEADIQALRAFATALDNEITAQQ